MAPGTMSLMTRAPWLPPTTSRRSGPFGSGDANGTAAAVRIAIEHARKRGGNCVDAAGEKAVGATEHGIGVVNDAGHAEQPCRHQRRQRRIAAEADHGSRF